MSEMRMVALSEAEAKSLGRRFQSIPRRVARRWDTAADTTTVVAEVVEQCIRDHGGESIPKLSEIIADTITQRWANA